MKNLFIVLAMAGAIVIISCKKSNSGSASKLPLIQHKWMIVSVNGEALRYVGNANDYFNFATDSFLYVHMDQSYDTSAYSLLADNSTLLLYPVTDGVKSTTANSYKIKLLTNNQFVIGSFGSPFYSSDSLKKR